MHAKRIIISPTTHLCSIYGGELFDRVISEDFLLTEKACLCFIRQICEGIEYMHACKIIHLDMKVGHTHTRIIHV